MTTGDAPLGKWPAVIVAGGRSSRLGGGDKGLLLLDEHSILAHVVAGLRPQTSALALNINGDAGRFAGFGLPILADAVPGFQGPLAGILAGLNWARSSGSDRLVTAASDTPFLPADLVARLAAAAAPDAIVVARFGDRRSPLSALWPTALSEPLAAWLAGQEDRSVLRYMAQNKVAEMVFDGDADPFFNVNTPEDLAAARRRAAGQPDKT